MPLAHLDFGRPRKRDLHGGDHAAHGYLAALSRNGQVHESFVDDGGGRFQACAEIPRRDALERRHRSSEVRGELKRVVAVFGREPRVTIFAPPSRRRFPSWKDARSLYLFTHMFDIASPVWSPELDEPIPLYLLPLGPSSLQGIGFWAAAYRAHDTIWIQSGTLEMRAYREMADPASELAGYGRKACSDIEKATGKPTYYLLHRYYARREGEERRPCPGCGRPWAVRSPDDPGARFRDFFFRCDRCRLVSRLGDSIEGARLARIGEYRARRDRRDTKRPRKAKNAR
jgi:predicted  nucleic acid-binding Zn ribbon protein